uniref:Uncharacterized protein n=1 Tax=Manihot esculenta TaxID=3983 RepID=A0A2C9URV2_MANES
MQLPPKEFILGRDDGQLHAISVDEEDKRENEPHFFIKQRRAVLFAWLSGAVIIPNGDENFVGNKGCDISEQIIQELQLDQISESVSRDIIGLCADATAGLFYAYDQNSTFQVCKCKILIVGMDYHISCLYLRGPMGSLLCISMWHAFHEQCLIAHLTSHTNKTQVICAISCTALY